MDQSREGHGLVTPSGHQEEVGLGQVPDRVPDFAILVPDSKTFVIINLLHTFQVIISFRYGLITGGHSCLFKNLKYLTGWVQNY